MFSFYGVGLAIYWGHCYKLALAWNSSWRPASSKAHVTHWTLAASRGVFNETAHTVMRAQTLTIMLTVVVLTLCLAPVIGSTTRDVLLRTDRGRGHWEAGIGAVCGPGVTLCSVAWWVEPPQQRFPRRSA